MVTTILTIALTVVRLLLVTVNVIAFEKNHRKGDTHNMLYNALWVVFLLI